MDDLKGAAADVFKQGLAALSRGDLREYEGWAPRGMAIAVGAVTEAAILVTDSAVVEERTRLVNAATTSLWLSTYTFRDSAIVHTSSCEEGSRGRDGETRRFVRTRQRQHVRVA